MAAPPSCKWRRQENKPSKIAIFDFAAFFFLFSLGFHLLRVVVAAAVQWDKEARKTENEMRRNVV